ncbi:2-methylaconitate cis-trans isomerase PrpF family protein [Neobacillus soli]|uniref:2-methylaconitate cis-trans isomerase PrpF family protein n=1 Tax=Neobacillus soli TaxID=220688 RepID=UPI0008265428|nr:PrpF domain-containing protein [Neobacillus soli]
MSSFLKRYRIPTVIIRGGTSKGLILRTIDLPTIERLRDQVILRIYGSPDSSQIDGLGGGTSLTSKLALVSPASRIDADIDYTFGQVSIEKSVIDYRATCGNMAAAVGLYAAEEGYVRLTEPVTRVRIYNTNTKRIIVAEIPVANGQIKYEGEYKIDGVPGTSPKIMLNFNDSGGAFTGNTLPTSNVVDTIRLPNGQEFHVTIVDSVNPVVFVKASEVGAAGIELPNELNKNNHLLNLLEKIRIEAGIISGILKKGENITPASHALPKIAFVTQPMDYSNTNNEYIQKENIDITSRYISMGTLHRAYAVSGAIALATACQIPGTIPNKIVSSLGNVIRIGHPSGIIYTEATVQKEGNNWNVSRAAIGRTARRIMDGYAYVPSTIFSSDQSNAIKKEKSFN